MATFLFKAKSGEMEFISPYAEALFNQNLKENEGKQYRIEKVKKPVSADLRSYYFGAVIPEIRSTCDAWKDLTGAEIHEIVKKMLFYFETWNPKTNRTERFGRSVMSDSDWNNTTKAMQFLEVVREYLEGCGHEMPDSEEYKRVFKNSALTHEEYKKLKSQTSHT